MRGGAGGSVWELQTWSLKGLWNDQAGNTSVRLNTHMKLELWTWMTTKDRDRCQQTERREEKSRQKYNLGDGRRMKKHHRS